MFIFLDTMIISALCIINWSKKDNNNNNNNNNNNMMAKVEHENKLKSEKIELVLLY